MTKDRRTGLDLLRILSMMGVICLHVIGRGGLFEATVRGTLSFNIVRFFVIACTCSINVFAMLTGYLYIERPREKFRYASLVNLLGVVFFYCLALLIAVRVAAPELVVGARASLKALFPMVFGEYWYIIAYMPLFCVIPYINKPLNVLQKADFKRLILVLLFFFSILSLPGIRDYFSINKGYSPLWLLVCYLIGAYIKRFGFSKKPRKIYLFLIFFANCLLVLGSKYLMRALSLRLLHNNSLEDIFVTYPSPFIVANAVLLFAIFYDLKIKSPFLQKALYSLAGAAFSAYILHMNPLVYRLCKNCFASLAALHPLLLFGFCLAAPVAVYFVCYVIDIARKYLFRWTRLDKLFSLIGKGLDKLLVR